MNEDFKLFTERVGKISTSSPHSLNASVTVNDIPVDVEDVPITIHVNGVENAASAEGFK